MSVFEEIKEGLDQAIKYEKNNKSEENFLKIAGVDFDITESEFKQIAKKRILERHQINKSVASYTLTTGKFLDVPVFSEMYFFDNGKLDIVMFELDTYGVRDFPVSLRKFLKDVCENGPEGILRDESFKFEKTVDGISVLGWFRAETDELVIEFVKLPANSDQ